MLYEKRKLRIRAKIIAFTNRHASFLLYTFQSTAPFSPTIINGLPNFLKKELDCQQLYGRCGGCPPMPEPFSLSNP